MHAYMYAYIYKHKKHCFPRLLSMCLRKWTFIVTQQHLAG